MSSFTHSIPLKPCKVRKGTFSCWECKRRKKRCELQPGLSACVSCQRRGIACVGQDYEVDHGREDVEKRVTHVENLVKQFMRWRNESHKGPMSRHAPRGSVPFPLPASSLSNYLNVILPSSTATRTILESGGFLRMPGRILAAGPEELAEASETPSPRAHPAQFARKLMHLALCLQQLNEPASKAKSYVDVVSQNFTSSDTMIHSLDGIEILILEANFHINENKTKFGLLVLRRALAVAQSIGLDKMEEDYRANLTWLRLVAGDRMLSLTLGLPSTVPDENLTSLCEQHPQLRLNCLHTTLSGRIISRNERLVNDAQTDYSETRDMDCSMKQAARLMPHRWWTHGSLDQLEEMEVMIKTTSIITQLHHYFLVIALHQPYLLPEFQSAVDRGCALYSQLAASLASRELLLRYITFRSFHRGASYRGLDDKAVIAATTLLLSHLGAQQLGQANVMEHQRPLDVVMLEDVLSLLREVALPGPILQTLQDLVVFEEQVAGGSMYTWRKEQGIGLELAMPYFGMTSLALVDSNEV